MPFTVLFLLAALVIPPTKVSFTVGQQPVSITTSGSIEPAKTGSDLYRVALQADLSVFQQNLTALLKPEIDHSDKCGDRIDLQNALIAPHAPAAIVTVQVHYERWVCAKALGKQIVKRLVAGNGVVPVTFTPVVENGGVRIDVQPGDIQADGSLGELLRSGSVGEALREKIRKSIQSAIEKSTDWNATIPSGLKEIITLRQIVFEDGGDGRLALALSGEVHLSAEKLRVIEGAVAR